MSLFLPKTILPDAKSFTSRPEVFFQLRNFFLLKAFWSVFLLKLLLYRQYIVDLPLTLPMLQENLIGGLVVKNPPTNAGDADSILGWEDSLEKKMATHSSILVWKILWTEEPGGVYSLWGCKELDTTYHLNNNFLQSPLCYTLPLLCLLLNTPIYFNWSKTTYWIPTMVQITLQSLEGGKGVSCVSVSELPRQREWPL